LQNPEKFHGLGPYDLSHRRHLAPREGTPPNWQDVFGQTMVKLCKKNDKLIGITAAMPSGTSLKILETAMPHRYYDVGIAEEHAVSCFACGMATMGLHPVCAIYSTFLQRAYDCIVHDAALQDLPVIFCMDRAGLSAQDGPTHHGLYDIAYLRHVPNCVVMAPKDEDELVDMMFTATQVKHPDVSSVTRAARLKACRSNLNRRARSWESRGHPNFQGTAAKKWRFFPLGNMMGMGEVKPPRCLNAMATMLPSLTRVSPKPLGCRGDRGVRA
jgi:1-deoxy-D-xylulose-5-phosphate synthase